MHDECVSLLWASRSFSCGFSATEPADTPLLRGKHGCNCNFFFFFFFSGGSLVSSFVRARCPRGCGDGLRNKFGWLRCEWTKLFSSEGMQFLRGCWNAEIWTLNSRSKLRNGQLIFALLCRVLQIFKSSHSWSQRLRRFLYVKVQENRV